MKNGWARLFILMLFTAALFPASTPASAQEDISYAPAESWVVDPGLLKEATAATKGLASRIRLISNQIFVEADGDGDHYFRQVYQVENASVLQKAGTITATFIDGTNRLIIHHAVILRGGERIDLLADGVEFQTYRPESRAKEGVISGQVVAYLQIPDLQVGDSVDFAVTFVDEHPLLKGQSEGEMNLGGGMLVDRWHYRLSWHEDVKLNRKFGKQVPTLNDGKIGDTNFVEAVKDNLAVKGLGEAMPQTLLEGYSLEYSTFSDWPQVASWATPLFESAIVSLPDGDLGQRIADIAAQYSNDLDRAEAALRMVQKEVRYTGNFAGLGGYKPENAQRVWNQRFGDCKGKTVLLLSILRKLNIEAIPVMVSFNYPHLVSGHIARPSTFDHVIVQATIDDRVYWLDGTRTSDRDIRNLMQPGFLNGLPIAAERRLVELPGTYYPDPVETSDISIDASAGFDLPAKITMTTIHRGESATAFDRKTAKTSDQQRQAFIDQLREETKDEGYRIENIKYFSKPGRSEAGFAITGLLKLDWEEGDEFWELPVGQLQAGRDFAVERSDPEQKDLPVYVLPRRYETRISIKLPDAGSEYFLDGSSFDRTIGPARYIREAKLVGKLFTGRVETIISTANLAMADAKGFDEESDTLFEDKIFITAERAGKSILRTERRIITTAIETEQAGKVDKALAELASEIKLRRASAELHHARAQMLIRNKREGAERELQKALLIDPDHADSLEALAQIYAEEGDVDFANSYVERLLKADPGNRWAKRWPELRKKIESAALKGPLSNNQPNMNKAEK